MCKNDMLLPVLLHGEPRDLAEKHHILLPFCKVLDSLQFLMAEEEKYNVIISIVNRELLLLQGRILENRRNFLRGENCETLETFRQKGGALPFIVIAIEDLSALLKEDADGEATAVLRKLLQKGPAMGLHIAAGSSGSLPGEWKEFLQEK